LSGRTCRRHAALREFLTRNRIPHGFLDVETDEHAEGLMREFGVAPADTPLLLRGSLALQADPAIGCREHARPRPVA
jgi:hypothetical protein